MKKYMKISGAIILILLIINLVLSIWINKLKQENISKTKELINLYKQENVVNNN